MAEESQAAGKALLTALTTGFVHAALDARHGFAHFPHACKGRAILTTGKTKTTLVNRGFARFGCHGVSFSLANSRCLRGKRVYFNRFDSLCADLCVGHLFQGKKLKACK